MATIAELAGDRVVVEVEHRDIALDSPFEGPLVDAMKAALLAEDPDVLVLLHSDGEPAQVEEALTGLPGAVRLTAVREDTLITQLFNFTEPPSPLAVTGLEQIIERLGDSA